MQIQFGLKNTINFKDGDPRLGPFDPTATQITDLMAPLQKIIQDNDRFEVRWDLQGQHPRQEFVAEIYDNNQLAGKVELPDSTFFNPVHAITGILYHVYKRLPGADAALKAIDPQLP